MRKANSEYYPEFRALFEVHEPSLLPEFDQKVKDCRPLEVFMWLESLRSRNWVDHECVGVRCDSMQQLSYANQRKKRESRRRF